MTHLKFYIVYIQGWDLSAIKISKNALKKTKMTGYAKKVNFKNAFKCSKLRKCILG